MKRLDTRANATNLRTILPAALLLAGGVGIRGQTPAEVEDLKAKRRVMEQTMQEMKQRIAELENNKAPPSLPTAGPNSPADPASNRVSFWPIATETIGRP